MVALQRFSDGRRLFVVNADKMAIIRSAVLEAHAISRICAPSDIHEPPRGYAASPRVRAHIPNITHTYLGPTRKAVPFSEPSFGLVRLGVSMPRLLSAHQPSHIILKRAKVSVFLDLALNSTDRFVYRYQTIIQPLALQVLHPIPPDPVLSRIPVQNTLISFILKGFRNLVWKESYISFHENAPLTCDDLPCQP